MFRLPLLRLAIYGLLLEIITAPLLASDDDDDESDMPSWLIPSGWIPAGGGLGS